MMQRAGDSPSPSSSPAAEKGDGAQPLRKPVYRRVVLKLSGEAMAGDQGFGLDLDVVQRSARDIRALCELGVQVAAQSPEYVSREDVPPAVIEAEREIYARQARGEGKPEQVIDRIVNGRLEKFFQQVCLLEQPFIKNPDQTVQQLIQEKIAATGENITVRRFVRFERGEGLAKPEQDFAAEVMAQVKG